jgi:hypothetical protein
MRAVVLRSGSVVLRSGPQLLRSGADLLRSGSCPDLLRSGPGCSQLLRSGALRCSVVLRSGS